MAERSRVLVVADASASFTPPPEWDITRVGTAGEALTRLQTQSYDGLYASADPQSARYACGLLQMGALLEVLEDGVVVLNPEGRILWANATFEKWCGFSVQDKLLFDVLGGPKILGPDPTPIASAFLGISCESRLQRGNQFLQLRITPVRDPQGEVVRVIGIVQDVSAEVARQLMLDALYQAGTELAALNPEKLAEMDQQERIDFLRYKIRYFTHDLLHYDVVEIRLLDAATGELRPLLAEGLTEEAEKRVLFARPEGNGVTGYVAATGKSYVCADAVTDPHFIEGAKGARSSLTIALKWDDKVIGTFNVENPQLNAFGPQDLAFTEIFCRELARALHTFELLMKEQQATATQSIDAINREVALPVDEILTAATSILERWIGHEPEMAEKLRVILTSARAVKESIQKVSADYTPPSSPLVGGTKPAESHPKLRGMRVLVVDNDDRIRKSAHALLGRLGCLVETASDGAKALTLARTSSYHSMLADIRLPDISGYEVYRQLRLAQPHAHVVLMTGYGYDSTHSIVKARQDGLRFVLFKPFRVDQLIHALENADGDPFSGSR